MSAKESSGVELFCQEHTVSFWGAVVAVSFGLLWFVFDVAGLPTLWLRLVVAAGVALIVAGLVFRWDKRVATLRLIHRYLDDADIKAAVILVYPLGRFVPTVRGIRLKVRRNGYPKSAFPPAVEKAAGQLGWDSWRIAGMTNRVVDLEFVDHPRKPDRDKADPGIRLGSTLDGTDLFFNPMSGVRHLLITGATGTGKTVFVRNLIRQTVDAFGDKVAFASFDTTGQLFPGSFPGKMILKCTDAAKDMDSALTAMAAERRRREEYLAETGLAEIEPSEEFPLLIVVIEEAANLPSKIPSTPIRQEYLRMLQIWASEARKWAACCVVVAQRADASQVFGGGSPRNNFETRISFRQDKDGLRMSHSISPDAVGMLKRGVCLVSGLTDKSGEAVYDEFSNLDWMSAQDYRQWVS